ncbi:ABC-type nitrate/sulfonate/bicarbonate transport system, substrate-binding protein [Agrobacterium fabrum]|uniref:ABC-type nitrate/sulfonate/bicarbonate transport system, substrate-binding protein n=1 Tax=Agrobacterium fabrum TaxID=1176649 RepID=A0A7Z7BRR5_9HYPH|nr:ABC transporter substrate-binding protein [Agrobacterium fabrum]SDK32902.1 ABC-type nitrate/sulfonate/bicarbonate transport system, substrate-binding protein [Agrobacterium fabrum]
MAFLLSRRSLLMAAAASALPLTAQRAVSKDAKLVQIAWDWLPSSQYAGFFKAAQDGLFEKKNLKVEFTPGGPNSPSPLILLAAGKADVAAGTWLSTLDAIAKGNDFVVIGAEFPQSPGGILSLPAKPIRKASDINGKTMMIQDPSLSVIFDGMIAFAGEKPDYKVIPTGFSADPLFQGDGDGYLCFVNNQPLELENMGMQPEKDFVLATFHELGYDIPETLMVVTRASLEKERSTLVDYLEALLQGWKEHEQDPEKTLSYLVKTYGQDYGLQLDLEKKKDALQAKLTYPPGGGGRFQIADSQIDRMYDLAKLTGRGAPAREAVIDMSLLTEAMARMR